MEVRLLAHCQLPEAPFYSSVCRYSRISLWQPTGLPIIIGRRTWSLWERALTAHRMPAPPTTFGMQRDLLDRRKLYSHVMGWLCSMNASKSETRRKSHFVSDLR